MPSQVMHFDRRFLLKGLRGIHRRLARPAVSQRPDCDFSPDSAASAIYDLLTSGQPAMIGRFGSNELNCIANYLATKSADRPWFNYIRSRAYPWWWDANIVEPLVQGAGFFPSEISAIERFSEMMLQDIPQLDLLGSWLPQENILDTELQRCQKVDLELLNPFFSQVPWTRALAGRKVLVIHPFARTIEAQYLKRNQLFKHNLLPAFDLCTIKAVQSIAGEKTEFADWFAALDSMKVAMDAVEYDICLIGCGAYGFPLAAHAKRRGRVGFHMGGALQLLFGIRGKRWENQNYHPDYNFSVLMNEYWVKPGKEERPKAADKVEGACYW